MTFKVVHYKEVEEEEAGLSGSLEEEQRLLKEMGWREDDEQNRHFSEEELKSIEVIKKQLNTVTRINEISI